MPTDCRSAKIILPTCTVKCVNAYVDWLYSQRMSSLIDDNAAGRHPTLYGDLVEAYTFGEKIQDDVYCDSLLGAMADAVDNGYNPSSLAIQQIYAGTSENAPVRDFHVSVYADVGKGSWMSHAPDVFPRQFLMDLSIKLLNGDTSKQSFWGCRRHWFKQRRR